MTRCCSPPDITRATTVRNFNPARSPIPMTVSSAPATMPARSRPESPRAGIRLDADGNQNPSQKLLKSWADDGLSIGEPILGTAAPVEATKTAAKDDKGWWSRNADYLVDDLKIGWNTLANAFDGWQAAQYSELFEANRAKYGDAPADPTVVENQTGLKAEYDRHMANVARRSAENQQISQRGRPRLSSSSRPPRARTSSSRRPSWAMPW